MSSGYYRVGQYYVDTSTPASPVLWRCTGAGTNSTATWAKVTGGSAISAGAYSWTTAYSIGSIVWIDTTATYGGVSVLAGIYICIAATVGSPTGNQVPQFPLPRSGTVYWRLLGFAPQNMGICNASGSQSVYVQASGSFGV
jgi:hypothetical protein